MSDYFQVFFRTKKGGHGIDYETAKAEFLSVFRNYKVNLLLELPAKMRLHISIEASNEEVAKLSGRLGYTYGILSAHEEPYLGEELHSHNTARWVVGWIRFRDTKILLTEIYRQDKKELLDNAPHQRIFYVEKDGEVKQVKGQRRKRGVSPSDAKFILNISELNGNEVVLDPFAGIGGLVIECLSRGFKVFSSDLDPVVRPGLAYVTNNRCALADARKLPFKDGTFDTIITEPPFSNKYRQSVIDSLPELCRMIKPNGKIVLFIAQDMYDSITAYMKEVEFYLVRDFTLRRNDKLISHVLRFERNNNIV
jgi:16S rRNA G966 N2-methylase RsmD